MTTGSQSPLTPQSRPNWYQRLFAHMLASESKTSKQYYDAHKRALLGDLHGDVLEIGPGTGPNLGYYPRDVRWIGIEPNPAMFPHLQQEAQRLGMNVQLHEGKSERLEADDNSVDAVVSTLVLCSVPDPQRTLQEIRRVLKVGGRFVFIEHVAAPHDSRSYRIQRLVKPLWKPFSDGCNPDRDTGATIEGAGFSRVHIDPFRLDIPIVAPHIAGYAIK